MTTYILIGVIGVVLIVMIIGFVCTNKHRRNDRKTSRGELNQQMSYSGAGQSLGGHLYDDPQTIIPPRPTTSGPELMMIRPPNETAVTYDNPSYNTN